MNSPSCFVQEVSAFCFSRIERMVSSSKPASYFSKVLAVPDLSDLRLQVGYADQNFSKFSENFLLSFLVSFEGLFCVLKNLTRGSKVFLLFWLKILTSKVFY